MSSLATGCVIVLAANDTGKILRKVMVTTFEEVQEIHNKFPRNDIAVFERNDEKDPGDCWTFFPELEDPRYWQYERRYR